ncbi:MAG: redoxin family protein [Acidobacteriales bacterium]|nr:redoxin family protein [Terriglobales bacterium]
MAQLESQKREIDAAGARLAYIAAEKRDGVWNPGTFLAKHPISFPFLLDEDRAVTKEYGLHHAIGTDALNIAHPATLVIDRSATVRWIYRGDNQHDRAPLDNVLDAVREIRN